MEIIPVGQGLKNVHWVEPHEREVKFYVDKLGVNTRSESIVDRPEKPPDPGTHPVFDLIFRADIQRKNEEIKQQTAVAERYQPSVRRIGQNIGTFLDTIV